MSNLIELLDNIINHSANCTRPINDVIAHYEIVITNYENLINRSRHPTTFDEKRFVETPSALKYKILNKLYKQLALVISLKLISDSGYSNYGKIVSEKYVNRPSGIYRYDIALGIKLKTPSIPLIHFRMFSQDKIEEIHLNQLIEKETDFKQFDIHSCNVNRYNYLLPKSGSYICPGCAYQQHYRNNIIDLPPEIKKISEWIRTNMLPADIIEYLKGSLKESNGFRMWITTPTDN